MYLTVSHVQKSTARFRFVNATVQCFGRKEMQLCELSWVQTYFELVDNHTTVYKCTLNRSVYQLDMRTSNYIQNGVLNRGWARVKSAMVEMTLIEV